MGLEAESGSTDHLYKNGRGAEGRGGGREEGEGKGGRGGEERRGEGKPCLAQKTRPRQPEIVVARLRCRGLKAPSKLGEALTTQLAKQRRSSS